VSLRIALFVNPRKVISTKRNRSAIKNSNKNVDIIVKCGQHVSEITFIRHTESQNNGKLNNLKVFGSMKTKGSKLDSQNHPRSLTPEEGEP
jgi:hypothetical protein